MDPHPAKPPGHRHVDAAIWDAGDGQHGKRHPHPAARQFHGRRLCGADKISGETLTEEYLTRNYGCLSCVIRCERRVKVNEREVKGPEYRRWGCWLQSCEQRYAADY
jgi:hypothetical protein